MQQLQTLAPGQPQPEFAGAVPTPARRSAVSRRDLLPTEESIRSSRIAVLLVLALVASSSVPWYASLGLAVDWATGLPVAAAMVLMFVLHWRLSIAPRTLADRAIADTVLVACFILLATNLGAPAQYLAVAFRRPLIDHWLAAADASLGIDVGRLAAWTATHPLVAGVLQFAYSSLLPQFLGALLLLGLLYKDRARLWEYCFHFHFCLLLTLAGLALFPAACAFQFLDFDSVLPQQRFIAHFNGVRDGSFTTIRLDDLEGLISMPSFHVAGGLMVTWVFRGYRRPFVLLLVLNSLMIASTFMTGAHYFVDVLSTLVMFALSAGVYRVMTNSGR